MFIDPALLISWPTAKCPSKAITFHGIQHDTRQFSNLGSLASVHQPRTDMRSEFSVTVGKEIMRAIEHCTT